MTSLCLFFALALTRPALFFTDLLNIMPDSAVAVPGVGRISRPHFAEPYGVASACFERRLQDASAVPALSALPDVNLSPYWPDAAYAAPSNRVIKSTRFVVPGGAGGAGRGAVPGLAEHILAYRQDFGASLIQDSDPPAFGWCSDPFAAASSNDWLAAWRTFASVSNDIPVSTWTLYSGPRSSPPCDMLGYFADLAGVFDTQAPAALAVEYSALFDAVYDRGPSETVSGLMAAAIPSCVPAAVTNRTLRLDRNFLTALEAAASLEDTRYDVASDIVCTHQRTSATAMRDAVGARVATLTLTPDFDTETLIGRISGGLPEMLDGSFGSVRTNTLAGGNFRYSARIPRNSSASWDIGCTDAPITLPASDLLDAVTLNMQLPVGSSVTLAGTVTFDSGGFYWVGSLPGVGIAEAYAAFPTSVSCTVDVNVSTSRTGVFIIPDAPGVNYSFLDNFYWDAGRVASVDAYFQEGLRWSDRYEDAADPLSGAWYNLSYQELSPWRYPAYRSQQLRHRKAVSLVDCSFSAFSNAWHSALLDLRAAARQKFIDMGATMPEDPVSTCMPPATDLDPAIAAASAAITNAFDVTAALYDLTISRPSSSVYTLVASYGGSTKATVDISSGSGSVPAGVLIFSDSGTVSLPDSTTTNFAARVEADAGAVIRLRTRYYNLSNIP